MNQTPRDFRKLQVWQRGHALTLSVYRATEQFPTEERYGLTSQLRRSSASIPATIAEGCGRGTNRELARYMSISQGSASETDYHLLLARDLGYLESSLAEELVCEAQAIGRMLQSYRTKLKGGPRDA
jgi:four helix bundle protein